MNCFQNELGAGFALSTLTQGCALQKCHQRQTSKFGSSSAEAPPRAGITWPEAPGQTHPAAANAFGKVPPWSCVLEVMQSSECNHQDKIRGKPGEEGLGGDEKTHSIK